MPTALNDLFSGQLLALILYLRRQKILSETGWIIDNRDRFEQYLDEKNLQLHAQSLWWSLLETVKSLMDPIYVCFTFIQGKDTLVPEKKNRL